MAFMMMGSGLEPHETRAPRPLPYTHLDICGSAGPFPGIPTGTPLPAFTKHFVLPRIN
jgi:leucyl aminopeptidase